MARIVLSLAPTPSLRDAAGAPALDGLEWMADGGDPARAEVLVSLWPRRELQEAGLQWTDFPDLRLVKVLTAGVNHIGWSDYPCDVPLAGTPGALGPAIAEHALAMTLAWTRRLIETTDAVRAGRFELGTPVRSLTAQRVGIVGFGGTGQAVARLFATLGVRCRAVSRSGTGPRGDVEWLGTMADLPRLLAASDVVVLAVPLTHATHGLVDEAFLAAMPEEALLVNVARGHVVDEGALWSWLDADHHRRAAALDVWWRYPRDGTGRPFTLPFERLPNVIMTPHNAPNVPGHRETMLRAALQDVQRFLEDGTVLHRADPADYVTAD